jgi:ubiquinone/menaquinone biosynthesis C-methylase UbiE
MAPHRDVAAFDERALSYETGCLGRLHHEIAARTAKLVLATAPGARRILDIGCGTGYLLRLLARRLPDATALVGVDPAPAMLRVAATRAADERLDFCAGVAERLPFPSGRFDLVVSTTSFDHWTDQGSGLEECARVLVPGGTVAVVDQISPFLIPTLVGGRRDKARTKWRVTPLLVAAGFRSAEWHDVYAVIIKAVTATR